MVIMEMAMSVLFNVHIVSKSFAELSSPIGILMGLWSHANLPSLVHLALNVLNMN